MPTPSPRTPHQLVEPGHPSPPQDTESKIHHHALRRFCQWHRWRERIKHPPSVHCIGRRDEQPRRAHRGEVFERRVQPPTGAAAQHRCRLAAAQRERLQQASPHRVGEHGKDQVGFPLRRNRSRRWGWGCSLHGAIIGKAPPACKPAFRRPEITRLRCRNKREHSAIGWAGCRNKREHSAIGWAGCRNKPDDSAIVGSECRNKPQDSAIGSSSDRNKPRDSSIGLPAFSYKPEDSAIGSSGNRNKPRHSAIVFQDIGNKPGHSAIGPPDIGNPPRKCRAERKSATHGNYDCPCAWD